MRIPVENEGDRASAVHYMLYLIASTFIWNAEFICLASVFEQIKSFYSALEADLLSLTNNQMPDPPSPECPSSFFVVAYTDGSCPNNKIVSPDNPAGWGFAAMSSDTPAEPTQDTCWEVSYGPVKTTPTDITILPEVWGSNNTGELKALIELFDYLLYYANLPSRSDVTIYTDSEYAMRLILGDSLPNTHHQLVTLAQQYFAALRTLHHVTLSKVAGHSGVIGNELADSLAKKGVKEYGSLGRFSGPRTAALSPPDIGYNTDQWLSLYRRTESPLTGYTPQTHTPHSHAPGFGQKALDFSFYVGIYYLLSGSYGPHGR